MPTSGPGTMIGNTFYNKLSTGLFLILTSLVLFTFNDYGMSWDEVWQHNYGDFVLRFYTSFFKERQAIQFLEVRYYGGFFEILSRLATRILPFGVFESRHLASALFGVVGVFGCLKVTRLLSTPGAAFWASLLLTLYPSYYGHMFINSKDIPFAVLYVWTLYYLLRLVREFPHVSFKAAARLGIAAGLAMGVRVGGLILLCYLYLFIAVILTLWLLRRQTPSLSRWSIVSRTLLMVALTTLIAYIIMLGFWPYSQTKPFVKPFEALAWFARNEHHPSSIDYIPRHLAFKLPELCLGLVAVGLYLGIRALYTRGMSRDFQVTLSYGLVAFSILFPLSYAVLTTPKLYDEVRHFLFVIPPLFCLIGITLDRVLEAAFRRVVAGTLISMTVGGYLLLLILLMIKLHPYEYTYYNWLIGGVDGAAQRGYLTEYWGTSYKEAVHRLTDYLRARDGKEFSKKEYRILIGDAPWCAVNYFPGNFVEVTKPDDADIYLTITRYARTASAYDGPRIVAVSRLRTTFAIGKLIQPTLRSSGSK